ncbi:hypothetical protein NDU88_006795 [Pleurodeles waltl]|uniref:Uncharacterized protein n=1 Tax=Pleurodeles waltl TaxID=8319 RepID=A0AAV7QPZ0_PLEWA|nr:hypothetical protein NDU88_006795 [Pleurodeles waltl]
MNGVASKAYARPRFELKSRSEARNCKMEIINGLRDQRTQKPPSWKGNFDQRKEKKTQTINVNEVDRAKCEVRGMHMCNQET